MTEKSASLPIPPPREAKITTKITILWAVLGPLIHGTAAYLIDATTKSNIPPHINIFALHLMFTYIFGAIPALVVGFIIGRRAQRTGWVTFRFTLIVNVAIAFVLSLLIWSGFRGRLPNSDNLIELGSFALIFVASAAITAAILWWLISKFVVGSRQDQLPGNPTPS